MHAGKNRSGAEEVGKQIRAIDGDYHLYLADFQQDDALDQFVELAWQWRNGVDIWVNNAGVDVRPVPLPIFRSNKSWICWPGRWT
ncbi:MAG: hypothetical protein R3C28_10175 [Pirellulaceae bacterium]